MAAYLTLSGAIVGLDDYEDTELPPITTAPTFQPEF